MPTFLFAFAGGGASSWRGYVRADPPDLALCPVALPGRERRAAEPQPRRLDDLARSLGETILPLLGGPFVFFGHSFGAILATAVARHLHGRHGLSPALLVAACARPVHRRVKYGDPISGLSDEEFLDALGRRTGVAPLAEFRDRPEAMSAFLPPLRTDLALMEASATPPASPVADAVLSVGGTDDPDISPEDVRSWGAYSRGPHRHHMVPGGHFTIFDRVDPVLGLVSQACGEVLGNDGKEA
ncbi:thioesterase II family protein [Actinokineospora guangxiensis]|uniref:Thioesterase II family protein n=1 Tax=Actinokineospora guangxiensis TaxID=1490288 RepID=A0ABW0ESB1_9PSEU